MTPTRPAPDGLVAFIGPSLSVECAERHAPGVRYLPPIRQGDLSTVLAFDKPRAVLIVDGEFGQRLSVWHKEILAAIDLGVRVIGASSMGALRAAELDRFGMEGVGAIYEHFRDHFLTADEDVALLHADAEDGWRPLTWPLVNLRVTVASLVDGARIDRGDAEAVLAAAQSLSFRDRVAPALAERLVASGVAEPRALQLAALVKEHYVDQKRVDALAGLAYLRDVDRIARPPFEPPERFDRRQMGIEFSDVIVTRAGGTVRRYQLVNDAALHLADFAELAARATDRYAALELAREGGVVATAAQTAAERARFLRRRGLTEDTVAAWLAANDLDETRLGELMADEARLRQVRRQIRDQRFFESNRRLIIEQLQLEGRYAEVADNAARRRKMADASPGEPFPTTQEELSRLVGQHAAATGWRPEADVVAVADDGGFESPQAFVLALADAVAAATEIDRRRRRVAQLLGLGQPPSPAGDQPGEQAGAQPGKRRSVSGRRVHGMLESHQLAHVMLATLELGLPDALADGPRPLEELAEATAARPDRLERLLWALAPLGLVSAEGDRWQLSDEGQHLAGPGGLRAYAEHLQEESLTVWQSLAAVIRGADPAHYPTSERGDRAIHAAAAALGLTEAVAAALALQPGDHVVDLGGGLGALVEEIATRRADVALTLVELTATAALAAERLAGLEVGARITVEASGLGPEPTADADVVVLQRILFNLEDGPAAEVLATARRRLRPGGRIEVFDVLGDRSAVAGFCDLYNLARSGGGVRDEAQWRTLAATCGLSLEIGAKVQSPLTRLTLRPEDSAVTTLNAGARAEAPPLRYDGRAYREHKEFVWGTHRAMPPEQTLARIRPHLHLAGITRVADITGLDSLGIPVAVAIRPGSQTLAVEGGKGASLVAAATSAAMEALERFVAESDDLAEHWGTVADVADRLAAPIDVFPRWRAANVWPRRQYPWAEMRDLRTDRPYLVPAALVRLHMPDGIGTHTPWATSSNGLASGNHLPEAICAGLYEVIERDAVSCWKAAEAKGSPPLVVDPESIVAPVISAILAQLSEAGIRTTIHWCPNDIGVPTCTAAIVDERRHMGVYAGYGCHLDPEIAMIRAVTEAVQGRTIFVAGARDDLLQGGYDVLKRADVGARDRLSQGVQVSVADIANRATDSFHGDIAVLLDQLGAAGFERVLARLDARRFEISVARVLVPGLEPYRFQWIGVGERAHRFDPTPWTAGRRALG